MLRPLKSIIVLFFVSFLTTISCKKEEKNEPCTENNCNLNGKWIEGSWNHLYTNSDSIINNGNWTVSDTVNDINSTYVHWSNDNDSLVLLTTFIGSDTAWIRGEYIGDGYNNNVTTINVTGISYLLNDTLSVSGIDYQIIDYLSDNSNLDSNYRYFVKVQILLPFEGCKFYIELFKRQND